MSFPGDPFAKTVTGFPRPVVQPNIDPDSGPQASLSISCSWLPLITNAVRTMLQQATWDDVNGVGLAVLGGRAQQAVEIFSAAQNETGCNEAFPPIACNYDLTETLGAFNFYTFTFTAPGLCIPVGTLYPSAAWSLSFGIFPFYDCTNSLMRFFMSISGLTVNTIRIRGTFAIDRRITIIIDGVIGPHVDLLAGPIDFTFVGTFTGSQLDIEASVNDSADTSSFITEIDLDQFGDCK